MHAYVTEIFAVEWFCRNVLILYSQASLKRMPANPLVVLLGVWGSFVFNHALLLFSANASYPSLGSHTYVVVAHGLVVDSMSRLMSSVLSVRSCVSQGEPWQPIGFWSKPASTGETRVVTTAFGYFIACPQSSARSHGAVVMYRKRKNISIKRDTSPIHVAIASKKWNFIEFGICHIQLLRFQLSKYFQNTSPRPVCILLRRHDRCSFQDEYSKPHAARY
jgi:hypothetical protein